MAGFGGGFGGIGAAKTFSSNPWLPSNGRFEVKIEKCLINDGNKGLFYIIEFEVEKSNHPQMRPGTVASQRIKKGTAAASNIKNFLLAAVVGAGLAETAEEAEEQLGCEYDKKGNVTKDLGAEVMEYSTSDDNPFAGTRLVVTTKDITTKAGAPFTVHNWSTLPKNESNEIPF